MSNIETRNAVIESTQLGAEDHGMLTCALNLKFPGGAQSFGGYALDRYDPELKARVGTAYGTEFVMRILDTVGVQSWEKLPGKHVRVRADYGKVYAIGHIIDDRWFTPETDLKEFTT